MKRYTIGLWALLLMGMLLVGCQGLGGEPETPIPSAIPSSQVPSPEPSPTEMVVEPTPTSTAEPVPTATARPEIPEELELISYRTLSQVVELTELALPDVMDLEFSPDGRYLRMRVPIDEGTHRDIFYDLEGGEEIFLLEGGQRTYFYPDSRSITSLDNHILARIDLRTGKKIEEFNRANQAAALSPDGSLLVEIEVHDQEPPGTTLRVIDLKTEKELWWTYLNGTLEKKNLNFDQDGRYMAVTFFVPPGTYVSMVWRAGTGRVSYTEYGYTEIVLHPFGSEIAVSSGRRSNISLFSTVTWEQKSYLGTAGEEPGYYDVAYSSGGRLIYALSDREITEASFWFPPTGEKIDLDLGLDLQAVTISPDRRFLATSDKSGAVIIWGVPK